MPVCGFWNQVVYAFGISIYGKINYLRISAKAF
jgi:hypothetical protein